MKSSYDFLVMAGLFSIAAYVYFMNKKSGDVALSDVEFSGATSISTRGVRNNNPLNIKWNAVNNWQGQTGKDDLGFVIFDDPINGIRAAARILQNYEKQGFMTVRGIIERWTSGDSQLIQDAYVQNVSRKMGVSEHDNLLAVQYPMLLEFMIFQENGVQPYSGEQILTGVSLA